MPEVSGLSLSPTRALNNLAYMKLMLHFLSPKNTYPGFAKGSLFFGPRSPYDSSTVLVEGGI